MKLPRQLLAAVGLIVVTLPALADAVVIEHAQVRAVPPGSPTSAAFMSLHNPAERDVRLVGASTSAAEVIELHNHQSVDGVMQMRRAGEIAIPAGGRVELAPGGLHMMLIGLTEPLVEGESVRIELEFDTGETQALQAPVKRILEQSGNDHAHGHQ
ncbi:copper chaperone PCu(A)C [Billgrantia saliphila]|uniref:copper chaperone PCu(A)C n=1 Tax=Billgrantia saliphila TaxID=1848458 RepID=UPI000CE2E7AE|nr:copper chaperone PCu(A)C [Halomonas saliphila]